MIDFSPVNTKEMTMYELCGRLTPDDLRALTDEMVNEMLGLIAECVDEDVTFVPNDRDAFDGDAVTNAEVSMPWTLGHVIVHTTASAEESAFLAAELARGVQRPGRSRYEVPWQCATTLALCRQRFEESRRLRLTSLAMWPDEPHLDNTCELKWVKGLVNPPVRFALGLRHDASHLEQIAYIVKQARAARS